MKIKLVADSSANITSIKDVDFSAVALKIIMGDHEFVDDSSLDIPDMMRLLKDHKGKTSTACPSVSDWLDAFGDADIVYGVSITSALSGCYNTGAIAAREYMQAHPDRRVFILDSLTAGPEVALILEKYRELILAGKDFDTVCAEIKRYLTTTRLNFSLETLDNFAKNGRVSPALAAVVGFLGIRIVGRASDEGTLEPLHKCRGEKRAISQLSAILDAAGYRGGKVRITHTENENTAETLRTLIREKFPAADIKVWTNRGICAYYAEKGGVLLAYET